MQNMNIFINELLIVLGRSNNFVWEYNNKKGLNKIIDFYFD